MSNVNDDWVFVVRKSSGSKAHRKMTLRRETSTTFTFLFIKTRQWSQSLTAALCFKAHLSLSHHLLMVHPQCWHAEANNITSLLLKHWIIKDETNVPLGSLVPKKNLLLWYFRRQNQLPGSEDKTTGLFNYLTTPSYH